MIDFLQNSHDGHPIGCFKGEVWGVFCVLILKF